MNEGRFLHFHDASLLKSHLIPILQNRRTRLLSSRHLGAGIRISRVLLSVMNEEPTELGRNTYGQAFCRVHLFRRDCHFEIRGDGINFLEEHLASEPKAQS